MVPTSSWEITSRRSNHPFSYKGDSGIPEGDGFDVRLGTVANSTEFDAWGGPRGLELSFSKH